MHNAKVCHVSAQICIFIKIDKLIDVSDFFTGSVSQENFFKYHTVLHDIVKGKLASAKLPPITESLCKEFNTQLNRLTDGNLFFCLDFRFTQLSKVLCCRF